MLQIVIPGREYSVEDKNGDVIFVSTKSQKLWLEHSLISVQKWEAKWHKVYLDPNLRMTREESNDYIRCMVVKPAEVDPNLFVSIPNKIVAEINAYINDPMTATTFTINGNKKTYGGKKKKVSAEVLYWQMSTLGIPFECRTWHLNQLLTMIHLFDIKNGGGKMSKKEQAEWQRSKMAAARAKHRKR